MVTKISIFADSLRKGKTDLIENEDYRIGRKGQYLYADTAIDKLLAYKVNSARGKKKDE